MEYALSDYVNQTVPTWVEIDSSTGIITGTAPPDPERELFYMYIDSTSATEFTDTSQKTLIISVILPEGALEFYDKFLVGTAQSMTVGGVSMGVGLSVISGSSLSSIWAIVEQIQLLILIMAIEDHIPEVVEYYLEGNSFFLFNFGFIPTKDASYLGFIPKWTDLEQTVNVAKRLELESSSTFTNHYTLILTFLLGFLICTVAKLMPN